MRIDGFRSADRRFQDLSSRHVPRADEVGDFEPVIFSVL